MSELKKYTRLGSNSRQLAALLQAKAPKGHMLAYINPREASLLKAHGGSGHAHADTGIPSFEDEFDMGPSTEFQPLDSSFDQYAEPSLGQGVPGGTPNFGPEAISAEGISPTYQAPGGLIGKGVPSDITQFGRTEVAGEGVSPSFKPTPVGAPAPGMVKSAADALGVKEDTLGRLGLAGALGALGSRTASRAAAQGQAGKAEMQALASPYQKSGAEMQSAAQRGELLPVAQQSLQAAQAQVAQDIQRRGGVGAQQAANQMANLRQQLLQQQYDYGLKLSGIGDNIALGAIKTGLQADQYVNQLTNSFYTNMAYIASGMSPGVRIGGRE